MKKNLAFVTVLLSISLGGAAGYFCAQWSVAKSDTQAAPQSVIAQTTQPTEAVQEETAPAQTYSVAEVAKLCTKSVVNITIKEIKQGYTGGSAYSENVVSHGTGVIVRKDGYIVTCHHVVEDADVIVVTLDDKTEYTAQLVGYDARFDLAVIRVEAEDLPEAKLGDSSKAISGEGVVVIGNPLGEFGSSVSAGVLSAPTREITIAGTPLRLMQTDAAVNPGNSGGGLFNMRGEFIGIVNAKISASGIEGIGFAIPLNTVREKVESIITNGSSGKQAVLGVSTKTATCSLDGKTTACLEIVSVREGSAAAAAGLAVGDFLLSLDGKNLASNDDLTLEIKYHYVGDQVIFRVLRGTQTLEFTVTLGE